MLKTRIHVTYFKTAELWINLHFFYQGIKLIKISHLTILEEVLIGGGYFKIVKNIYKHLYIPFFNTFLLDIYFPSKIIRHKIIQFFKNKIYLRIQFSFVKYKHYPLLHM